ncbi:MAG: exodeoxyribonuclease VII large subunit [Ignavibacteriales bacterium]|nr:exodeoxyribonuclease VII large subunit [Ignavibacteriales bacterium]
MENEKILSVSDITRQIKGVLELGFPNILVQGEISNFKLHSSGHLYFTLKDEGAQISAVMWRSRVNQLLFRPTDGMKVIARGNISVYEPRGSYQLDCIQIQPLGVGELQQAFERLKKKLSEEGLFDEGHKKPLPEFPMRLGIVTSPTGAAIRDMISVLSRRMPAVEVLLVPVKVQGIGAAEEIAEAIDDLNELKSLDVIIVGRGGGSLEDLWAFNEEIVARAIFRSKIPIISAVGHEIDYSISDFVADLRAPTPSAAAELAVKHKNELIELIRNFCYTMSSSMENSISSRRQTVETLVHSYSFNRPQDLLRQRSQSVDELMRRLEQSVTHYFQFTKHNLQSLSTRIESLNPRLVLKRGYTIVKQHGKAVSSARLLEEKQEADIEFYDGRSIVKVEQKIFNTDVKKRK